MIKRHLYITLIALLYTLMTEAIPYCDIRKFSIVDGLAANTISDIKQSYDKLMWFGTWNGLSFYDGYTFHTFRDDSGNPDILSTNRILSIEPTYKDNIWCVTYDRQLYVYDTHECHFKNIGQQINEKFGIDLRVSKIFPIKNGYTWVTDVNGQYILRTNSTIVNDSTPQLIKMGQNGLKSGKVWFIRADPKGREWILTEKGTTIFGSKFSTPIPFKWIRWVGDNVFLATEDGKLAMYNEQNRLIMIPMPEGVTRINELKNTGYQLLIATNLGVVIYNPRTFKFDIINVQSPSQPLPEVTNLYTDAYNMVWAFTKGMGVTLVNPRTGEKQWLFADQPNPSDRTASEGHFITQDENNTLWVIPHGGTFSYYDRKAGKLVPYLLRSNSSGNYRVPNITKYLLSDQGILWISGTHDLTQVVFKNHPFSIVGLDEGEEEVRAINAAPNGTLWAGYRNGIIQILDNKGQHKLGYLSPNGQLVTQQTQFTSQGVYSLYFDIRGRAWIGTNGDGLYVVSGGKVSHYMHDSENNSSLPNDKIYDIVADRYGRIWIATYGGGLSLVKETSEADISFVSKQNGLPWEKQHFNRARRISCTTTGTILVGTTDGLVTFSDAFTDPRKIKFYKTYHNQANDSTLKASDVNYIIEHTNGTIYISELGGLLEQITSKALQQNNLKVKYFENFTPNEGIVQSMIEDNRGRVWIIRESSIDAVTIKTGATEVYGPNDFDFNMSFTEARPYHDPSTNNISVGTPMGLLTFNPQTLKKTNYQPQIVFTTLHYNGESNSEPILHKAKLVIPANKRNLSISFASLDYQRKYQTKYLYRIDGLTPSGEWVSNGTRNSIAFNHISHGDYVLKVRATNSHGVWSKHIAELEIEVRPTFWESIWGRILLLLIAIVIVGAIFYSYNQRQRQNMNHEMSVLKNQFFSEAAHQLRTPLTLIGGPLHEVLQDEHGLTRKGREMLQIVERNSKEMLEMLNKILRYDNEVNFYTNSGLKEEDYDHTELENRDGQIDDSNAAQYLDKTTDEKTEEKELPSEQTAKAESHSDKAVTILVVEDNPDLRKYLYNIMADTYNVLLAENGKAGLLMARTKMPNLILTDVTMPVMDGITMIHQIKQDSTIADIPIIVLSAKASVEDQLKGFDEGIDAYLTKPFSSTYLLGRIESVINQRRKLQIDLIRKLKEAGDQNAINAFRLIPQVQPKSNSEQAQTGSMASQKISASQTDFTQKSEERRQKEFDFMSIQVNDRTTARILKYVTENIANPDLKIDDIADATGMSRSVLYNKIKNAVGMTPIDFVRHIRIMKASEMLQNSDDSLSTIAYNVGFSDPKYFSKVFKKETGIIPSEYRERTQKL